MRRTGIVWHERYAWHDLGAGAGPVRAGGWVEPGELLAEHAGTKRRFRNLLEVSGLLDDLIALRPRAASNEELGRFHTAEYLSRTRALSDAEGGPLGLDAWMPRGSYDIAALAAGGAIVAVDAVLDDEVDNAYALIRPPGHHAEADQGHGFCIFNNVVIAAHHARAKRGLSRLVILDWDVHHCNGTQAAFHEDPDVLVISVHQDGVFPPASGAAEDVGVGATINVPLPPGSGHGAYRDAFDRLVLPAMADFAPELVLVSSGFDANGFDPMSRQLLYSDAFRELTADVQRVADAACGGRLVMVHEGGYHVGATPFCGLAVVEELSGRRTEVEDPFGGLAHMPGQDLQPHQRDAVDRALRAHSTS